MFKVLDVCGRQYKYVSVFDYISSNEYHKKPYSVRILIENISRNLGDEGMEENYLNSVINWDAKKVKEKVDEIGFKPIRVIMQDFTGVPIVVDLATMRDKVKELGKNPSLINPKVQVDLVIDHSLQIDFYGSPDAEGKNIKLEFQRNRERYKLLKWAQRNLKNFRVIPPGKGIIHQINLEFLSKIVFEKSGILMYDTLVGTDSHTTMINSLGVLGWGVGGIEAEAVVLGQPYLMKLPQVVGVFLKGRLREGVNATDVVLTLTNILRSFGVVDKFVEFFGPALKDMDVETRATISNMAPEYGATLSLFPVDDRTIEYLWRTGRSEDEVRIAREYTKIQGLFRENYEENIEFSEVVEIDLSLVEPVVAGPRRPQDKVSLGSVKTFFLKELKERFSKNFSCEDGGLKDGDVVIASITSCTNTSNPYLLIGAGILAKKACERGLKTKNYVKTSFAPGSRVVEEYLKKLGLQRYLDELGFNIVGYGCTTCIGNSGPLPEKIEKEIKEKSLVVSAVLSGNRNFEARIHPLVKANYLASPILVVAYALAGTILIDFENEPIGFDSVGNPVFLKDIWPSEKEISEYLNSLNFREMFIEKYKNVFEGNYDWDSIEIEDSNTFVWDESSTYIKKPNYFDGYDFSGNYLEDINSARVLLLLGDSVTTDHISPAGNIPENSTAGKYLISLGVRKEDFNSYGARRGNHEVMVRGTFANVRIKNNMVSKEGGYTILYPEGIEMTVYEAAMEYKKRNIPVIVIGGKEYGTGSSRDWAAKGPYLLGVKAVIAESFERIHRSNLIGMGIVPLEFVGCSWKDLGIDGSEEFFIPLSSIKPRDVIDVKMLKKDGKTEIFKALVRIDTQNELQIVKSGGIMQNVLKNLLLA